MLVRDTGTEVGLLTLRPVQRPADMGPELVKADTVSKEQIETSRTCICSLGMYRARNGDTENLARPCEVRYGSS
jgi:hypothetical protein